MKAITKRMSAEAMNEMAKATTERVKNDLELGSRKLDIEEEPPIVTGKQIGRAHV